MRKKFLLSTTSIVSLTPLAVLLACNNPGSKPETKEVIDLNDKSVIDLNKIDSVENLMTKFNELTNVFMPHPIDQMVKIKEDSERVKNTPLITKDSYDRLKDYTQNIHFSVQELNFKFQDKTHKVKLDKIIEAVNKVSSSVEQDYNNFLDDIETSKALGKSMEIVPNMPALLSKMMGLNFAVKTMGFVSLPKYDNQYGYKYYLDMMDGYHEFSRNLSQSDVFKAWIAGKQYKLIANENLTLVNPGEGYDAMPQTDWKSLIPKPSKPQEIHNLEAQLVLSLSNVYSLVQKQI